MVEGWLYDGVTGLRRAVAVGAEAGAIRLDHEDGRSERIGASELDHLASREAHEVYGRRGLPGWRLGLPRGAHELASLLPRPVVYGGWVDRLGLGKALAAAVAASAAVLFIGSNLPGWLAPLVPHSWERSYGDLLLGDMGARACRGPGGQEALDRLARTLAPELRDVELHVVRSEWENAAALPGRRIVIFDELLARASGPDEIAGILAHEIAHIENRHVTETMIRQFTFGLFVSTLGGGTGGNLEMLMAADYSRDSEAEADRDAIRYLSRADVSPLGVAAFFRRVAGEEGRFQAIEDGLSYLSTHPAPADRERRFRESAGGRRDFKPPLSRDEWEALVNICRNDPERRDAYFGL